MQRLLSFGARGGAAAAASAAAAAPSSANCHAQTTRKLFVRTKDEPKQQATEEVSRASNSWLLPELQEGEVYFQPEEVEETVDQVFNAVWRPARAIAAADETSDVDTDFSSDSAESVGTEANMFIEAADHSAAPRSMQNVLLNMLKQPGVQHACLTALMADEGFRDMVKGQPLLEGANPARDAAEVLIEEIDETETREGEHPLSGLMNALGSHFARLGEGLKRTGDAIGSFLVDLGYKLHSFMGKPMTTGRPMPDGVPVRLEEEWWARAIMTVACSIFVVMVLRRAPVVSI